jgi:hypothetical protein
MCSPSLVPGDTHAWQDDDDSDSEEDDDDDDESNDDDKPKGPSKSGAPAAKPKDDPISQNV